ncbi:MAG TPA: PqqD family protein [Phycisphaerae bacterium]|nr:PqqD family protein [Phycisphaerae bacterium]
MAVERPTFSESWYRIAELRPSLRSTVQVHRQHFRGQMWHVLQDPAANQFFRLNSPAYALVAMLDGRRTVAEAWKICNERLGDEAPTQGEAIQLLGQLYTSNLLRAELPADAEGLLQRYRKRRVREIQGQLAGVLFLRIPVIDPDHFLERWVGILGRAFSWWGLILWLALVGSGLYFIAGRGADLADKASGIFDPENIVWLYASLVIVKVFHEFGHAFACKRFGRLTGRGGEVHVMGVMFLVFMPMPYLDASSAWAFRSKWHRVVVGAAGMLVELAIAAVAAIIWANTTPNTTINAICYNVMFLASVSTVLFNGNPLLRYDAYYILSDLLEIPNLANRSIQYLYYLVRRYAWSVRRAINPAHTPGERVWFVFYGIASTLYRLFIFAAILLFLTDRLPKELAFVAIAFGLVTAFGWVCVPVAKLVRYLATSGELDRVRPRAAASALVVAAAALVGVGLINAPYHERVEGIVEAADMAEVYAEEEGVMKDILPSGRPVSPDGPPLLECENPKLDAMLKTLRAEREMLDGQRIIAEQRAMLKEAEQKKSGIVAKDQEIATVEKQRAALTPRARLKGTWSAPEMDNVRGIYLRPGDKVGRVADLASLRIRAAAGQDVAAMLITRAYDRVDMRVKGRPTDRFGGTIVQRPQAGQEELPSAALGYQAGGKVQTAMEDPTGRKSQERFFPFLIAPDKDTDVRLLPGQRVVVRFTMPSEPLLVQWWRSLLRIIKVKFNI